MARAYEKQNGGGSNGWDVIWDISTGIFGFTLRVLSQNF
jgi:hypothetical protein